MISCPRSVPLSEASAPSECDSPLTAFEETHTDVDRFSLSLSLPHSYPFFPSPSPPSLSFSPFTPFHAILIHLKTTPALSFCSCTAF